MCWWITATKTLLCRPLHPRHSVMKDLAAVWTSHMTCVSRSSTHPTLTNSRVTGDCQLPKSMSVICLHGFCLFLSTSVNVWKKQNKDHWDWPIWKLSLFQCMTCVAIVILLLSSAPANHHSVFVCLEMSSDSSQGIHSGVQDNQALGCNLWHIWKDWDMHINNKRAGRELSPGYEYAGAGLYVYTATWEYSVQWCRRESQCIAIETLSLGEDSEPNPSYE